MDHLIKFGVRYTRLNSATNIYNREKRSITPCSQLLNKSADVKLISLILSSMYIVYPLGKLATKMTRSKKNIRSLLVLNEVIKTKLSFASYLTNLRNFVSLIIRKFSNICRLNLCEFNNVPFLFVLHVKIKDYW